MNAEPDYTEIANRIRNIALLGKFKDANSIEFGNEFAPKVESYLRECFEDSNEAFELIHRYRTEVPLGNQPHMIAEQAGNWLKRNSGEMKQCSEERGCKGKARLGFAEATDYADRLKDRHGKDYGVYRCPHCECMHLTTKLHKKDEYRELIYVTDQAVQT